MTELRASEEPRPPKAACRRKVRRRRCLGCPFCAPSGKCRDPRPRSGRCGDWVFYLRHGKQFRRLGVKPHDARTPSQRYWRGRLAAASQRYSAALTEAEQDACTAAGAKRRSRKRLGQCGPLTGQQYWVSTECARQPQGGAPEAQTASKPLQTKGISTSTWGTHRHIAAITQRPHRRNTRRAGKDEGQKQNEECRRQ